MSNDPFFAFLLFSTAPLFTTLRRTYRTTPRLVGRTWGLSRLNHVFPLPESSLPTLSPTECEGDRRTGQTELVSGRGRGAANLAG